MASLAHLFCYCISLLPVSISDWREKIPWIDFTFDNGLCLLECSMIRFAYLTFKCVSTQKCTRFLRQEVRKTTAILFHSPHVFAPPYARVSPNSCPRNMRNILGKNYRTFQRDNGNYAPRRTHYAARGLHNATRGWHNVSWGAAWFPLARGQGAVITL